MSRDELLKRLLERGWDEVSLREAAQLLSRIEEDPQTLEALRDYDSIRSTLKLEEEDAEPDAAWQPLPPNFGRGTGRPASRRNIPWMRWPALAAAIALIAAVGWTLALTDSAGNGPVDGDQSVAAQSPGRPSGVAHRRRSIRLSQAQIRRGADLFRSVEEVFEGRTRWVATAENTSELGLASAPVGRPRSLLMVRLVVTRGGRTVSDANMVIIPGHDAELTVPFEHGQDLRYQLATSADRPHRLSLWAEVRDGDGGKETLAALATRTRVEAGRVFGAGRMSTTNGRYELEVAFAEANAPSSPTP